MYIYLQCTTLAYNYAYYRILTISYDTYTHIYSKEAQQELPRTLDSIRSAVNRAPYLNIPITTTTGATIGGEKEEGNVTDVSPLHIDDSECSIQGPDLPFDRYVPIIN